MIDRNGDLPIIRQAGVLNISRGSVYYKPRPVPAQTLAIMRRIDELHLEYPFAGSRMLRDWPRAREALDGPHGRASDLSPPQHFKARAIAIRDGSRSRSFGHKIYPYLLRGVKVERPNQVWAMDITYIPMARGFVYLTAAAGWCTRRILSYRISITMEADFCIEALEDAMARYGKPEISA